MTQPRSSCDLAVTLALGGECLADIALLRGEPGLYGCVACDATVSRTIAAPAGDAPAVWASIDTARASGRARAWKLAGARAPDHVPARGRVFSAVCAAGLGQVLTRVRDMASSEGVGQRDLVALVGRFLTIGRAGAFVLAALDHHPRC